MENIKWTEVTLDEAAMGRIALRVLVAKIAEDGDEFSGFTDMKGVKRDLPNLAKKLGVDIVQLQAFHAQLLPQVIGARVGCRQVSLTT